MITTGVLVVLAALLALGVDSIFRKGFGQLEQDWVSESARRVRTAHTGELDALERSATDYSAWTDTYDYMADPALPYVANNMAASMFANLKLDAFLIFEPSGELRVGRTLVDGEVVPMGEEGLADALKPQARLVAGEAGRSARGVWAIGDTIALFAMKPILRDDGSGPPRGALVHVRYLNEDRLAGLRNTLNLDLALHRAAAGLADQPAKRELEDGASSVVNRVSEDLLQVHIPIHDVNGRLAAVYELKLPREIHRQGRQARLALLAVVGVLVIAAAVVIGRLLRSLVIARLEALHAAVQRVDATEDLRVRLPVTGADEITGLTRGINQMLDTLERGEAHRSAAERERAQLNLQLQQAQKMEAIGTLAGGLAHDFNNLLTSIQGSATLLRLEPEPAAADRHLRRIEQAAASAISLVRQMTTFGRRNPPAFMPVRLTAIVDDSLSLLRSSVPRTIEFKFRNEARSDVVHADAGQLQQVLVNLGTNSSHAMAGGTGTFEVCLAEATLPDPRRPETSQLPPGEYLRLTVSDTGEGISPEHLTRIFEPFFTTKPVGSGTGLGLAVAHGIVAQHRGAIGVESGVGRGTTIFIHLPKSTAAVPETVPPRAASEPAPRSAAGKLLLVDDDELVRETLEAGLRRRGYEVVPATSGMDALEKVRKRADAFDYVVTDQMMPGMTGTELGKILKQECPRLPMILITGFASALNEPKVKAMGFSAMLMKPVTMDDLDHAIRASKS